MTHRGVFDMFSELFSAHVNDDVVYFSNGKNSIRVRGLKGLGFDGQDIVFTMGDLKKNHLEWRLETVDSFLKTMKGANT